MTHLTSDELVDAVEDALAADRLAHVASCVECRDEVARLGAMLSETRALEMAEPSPLFWDHFSDRVREAVATEPAPGRRQPPWLPQWMRLPVLVPLTGMAILLLTLVTGVPRVRVADVSSETRLATSAASSLTEEDAALTADAGWAVISDLIGPMEFETAQQAGLVAAPGAADHAVLLLTAAQQQELVRLLRQELKAGG